MRVDIHLGQITSLPEGMRLHDKPALCPDLLIVGDVIPRHHVRVVLEPLFVKSVDQIFVAVKPAFPRKENVESLSDALCPGVLVAAAEDIHTLIPREIFGDTAVAVKKMIRHDDAVIAEVFVVGNVFGTRTPGARAGGVCVKMHFV